MNVNEKGNIGLIKVVADLYSKGYHCFTPFDDYSPIDCIAMDKTGKTFRIQIKYRTPGRGDKYEIAAQTVINGKGVSINRDLLDCWAVYLADIDKVVYMSINVMKDKGVHYITRKHISEMDERLKSAPC
jgi:hypothetical protein